MRGRLATELFTLGGMGMHDVTYRQMDAALRGLGAEASFPNLHHFSDGKFATKPPTLDIFCAYCDGVGELQADGENRQTIARVTAFVDQVRQGVSRHEAVAAAWMTHPLVTR